jgi:hypothetical protein
MNTPASAPAPTPTNAPRNPIEDREDVLLTACQAILDGLDAWEQAEQESESPNPQPFSDDLVIAIDDAILQFTSGDLPHNCRGLAAVVDTLDAAWQEFAQVASRRNPVPGPRFWQAIGSLRSEFEFKAPPVTDFTVEPVGELVAQKVSYNQIALIYSHNGQGPFMRAGQPAVELVKREIANPGSIIGPDFVHPRTAFERQQADRYTNWVAQRAEGLRARAAAEAAAGTTAGATAGRETIAELIAQGLSDHQIAKIKLIPLGEAIAERARIAANRRAIDDGRADGLQAATAADTNAEGEAGASINSSPANDNAKQSGRPGRPGRPPKNATATATETTDAEIAEWLADNPEATTAEAAAALRVEPRRIAAARALAAAAANAE